jgi:uncharacterized protein YciI
MTTFVALLKNKKAENLSPNLLDAHIAYLREQTGLGRVKLCGPFADNDGALQLIEAKDYPSAQSIIESDPFIKRGYYTSYELHELIEANESNNWLLTDDQTVRNLKNA